MWLTTASAFVSATERKRPSISRSGFTVLFSSHCEIFERSKSSFFPAERYAGQTARTSRQKLCGKPKTLPQVLPNFPLHRMRRRSVARH